MIVNTAELLVASQGNAQNCDRELAAQYIKRSLYVKNPQVSMKMASAGSFASFYVSVSSSSRRRPTTTNEEKGLSNPRNKIVRGSDLLSKLLKQKELPGIKCGTVLWETSEYNGSRFPSPQRH